MFSLTITDELRRVPNGVLGRELRDKPALNSSELRFSDPSPSPSLSPLLMELLSSQLKIKKGYSVSEKHVVINQPC